MLIYMSFIGVRLSIKGRVFGGGEGVRTFIENNTIQYSTVIIRYNNILHPMFTPDPFDHSRGFAVF